MSRLILGTVLRRTGIIGALICWFSSAVAADPIYLSTRRSAEGVARIEFDLQDASDAVFAGTTDPGPFHVARTTTVSGGGGASSVDVSQDTTISPTGWFGSGRVGTSALLGDAEFGLNTADAESAMEIGFRLAEPMFYRFAGTLSEDPDGGGFAQVGLSGPGVDWFVSSPAGGAVPLVTRSGLLSPGTYFFTALAHQSSGAYPNSGSGPQASAFNLEFGLSDQAPVPEPATLLLFGTGAALVGRRAWRRRREQSATGSFDPVGGTQGTT